MMNKSIPRDKKNDYSPEIIGTRHEFIVEKTGKGVDHLCQYSFDPSITSGNIENFIGVAQIPVGLAGPLVVNGEHAQGEFYVPLATSEGTLIASYNRGMRLFRECGGIKVTVVDDVMQRAPVFIFDDARQARDFGIWIDENFDEIKKAAESSTKSGKLRNIEQYAASRMRHLRFNFTTGDAAGQNMVSKATFFACEWIKTHYPPLRRYLLSGGMDTDKKHSAINVLHSRGKRVVAEAVIPSDILKRIMGVTTEKLYAAKPFILAGNQMAGSINNGAHSPNGLAALFIACGQDVANVAESSAGIAVTDLDDDGNLYMSMTIPSLIVATYGGGTGLATQRECLEMLDCYGEGKAKKFAEIVGATILAGEISLASAIMAGDWVSSHDQYGRNRT